MRSDWRLFLNTGKAHQTMRPKIVAVITSFVLMLHVVPTFAHGVQIDVTFDDATGEVTIRAVFDSGELLDGAQVAVFAPSDFVDPWLTGATDADGTFTFLPDYADEGEWGIQVRKAGHGGLVNTMITADMAPAEPATVADDTTTNAVMTDGRIVITGDAVFEVSGDVVIRTSGTTTASDSLSNGLTPVQIAIMSLSVIWGFVGTALYFGGRNRQPEQVTKG
jgi:nickel transport protein